MADIVPTEADYEVARRANVLWGRAINGPHVAVIAAALARKEALEEAAKIAETVEGHSPYCECALCLTTLSQAILQSIERGEG